VNVLLPPGHRLERIGIGLLIVVAALFPKLYGDQTYLLSEARLVMIYGLVAVTLNLLVGYGGQISLGHAGLLAVGAYTVAILGNHYNWPTLVLILAAAVVTGLVGLALGLPTGRLRGHYLAIATLGFGLAVPELALSTRFASLTNGSEGLIVPTPTISGLTFDSAAHPEAFYYFCLVAVVLCLLCILSFLGTSTGRRFMAVRDSEDAAAAMGINTWLTKVVLFTTSAFFTGIGGALLAFQDGVIAPSTFPFGLSLLFLAMVIVGGLASVWGSVAGALLLIVVQDKASSHAGLSDAIIGAVVVLVLLIAPDGLAGLAGRLWRLVGLGPPWRAGVGPRIRGRQVGERPPAEAGNGR
jgi:branched-chain amino acid transport system permease protein